MQKAPFANCDACPFKFRPMVPGEYTSEAKYTIVGESPGYDEVKQGRAFVGPSGRLLWAVGAELGMPRELCNVTNAVLCQPNTGEEKEEQLGAAAKCCEPRLRAELAEVDTPILLLGTTARESLFPKTENEEYNTVLNRWARDTRGRDVIATLHPAYVLREPDDAAMMFEGFEKYVKHTPVTHPHYHIEVVTTQERLVEVLGKAETSQRIVYDLETDQIDREYNKVLLMAITFDEEPDTTYIIPARHPQAPIDLLRGNKDLFNNLFWSSTAEMTAHNGKFDAVFLRVQYGHNARCDFDTMVAHFCLDENTKHGLKELGARFLDLPDWEIGLKDYLTKKSDLYSKIKWSVLAKYAGMDTVACLALSYMFEHLLKEDNLYDQPFMTFKMAEVKLFIDIESTGLQLDFEHLLKTQDIMEHDLDVLKNEFVGLSNGLVQNPNSPQQVAHYLWDVLKLEQPKGRKIKPRSTDKEVLDKLKSDHPFVVGLKKYRKIAKMKSSFIDNLIDASNEENIVRPDANTIGAETHRISVKTPAVQTMPRVGDTKSPLTIYTSTVRASFIPRPGMLMFADDYSQAELRIAAAVSRDPFLLGVFRDGRDLHSEVAIAMFGPAFTKEQRMLCKMFNFSYLYGGNEHSFAEDAQIPLDIAIDFVHQYNQVMPGLKAWKDAQEEQMMSCGFVRYRTGAKRRYPFIQNSNRDDARKASYNSPVQGSASHMTSLSGWRALPTVKKYGGNVLLLVHDSIIGEVPAENAVYVAKEVKHIMEQTASEFFPEVTWKADAEIGERWSQLHGI